MTSRLTLGGVGEDTEFAKSPQRCQMADRWSRAKKMRFLNKLIEATSCGETVILVSNSAASHLFLGNSGSCSGLYNLPILGGKEKGEKPCCLYSAAAEILPNHMQK